LATPRASTPAEQPEPAAAAKDVLRSETSGPKLELGYGPKLSLKMLENTQAAILKLLAERYVYPIVETGRQMPSKAGNTFSVFSTALNDYATFHLEKCKRLEGSEVDWIDPMQIPVFILGPPVLMRGQTPTLRALRDVIYKYRKIQQMVKTTIHELGVSEEVNKRNSDRIFKRPMMAEAGFAGVKYNSFLFVCAPGEDWAPGLCEARVEQLLMWIDDIRYEIDESIERYYAENTQMELLKLARLPNRPAPLSAQTGDNRPRKFYGGAADSDDSDEEGVVANRGYPATN